MPLADHLNPTARRRSISYDVANDIFHEPKRRAASLASDDPRFQSRVAIVLADVRVLLKVVASNTDDKDALVNLVGWTRSTTGPSTRAWMREPNGLPSSWESLQASTSLIIHSSSWFKVSSDIYTSTFLLQTYNSASCAYGHPTENSIA
jgi:hypothetical protein